MAAAQLRASHLLHGDADSVDLYQAVAVGKHDRIVWRWRDRLSVQLHKATDQTAVLNRMVSQLSGGLRRIDKGWSDPLIRKFLNQLDVDWPNATGKQIDQAFVKADRVFRKANVERLATPWSKRVEVSARRAGTGARRFVKETFLPRIAVGFNSTDRAAIKQFGVQSGWWLRDEVGRRSDMLTNKGRGIVQQGLKDGLGRYAIGAELNKQIPNLYQMRSGNYATVAASAGVQRARNFGHVSGYREAGIELLEFVAQLDEVTTEQCRYFDGQIMSVNDCYDLAQSGANVKRPEDIRHVNPFTSVVRDKETGKKYIQTANKVRLAEVTRSGVGVRDDRGQHRAMVMSRQLPVNASIGMPPLHHL